jgi:hypothetical protein
MRETAARLYNEVLELRRVLRSLLGIHHRDYRKLRFTGLPKSEVDEDDAPDMPDNEPAEADPPAPAVSSEETAA